MISYTYSWQLLKLYLSILTNVHPPPPFPGHPPTSRPDLRALVLANDLLGAICGRGPVGSIGDVDVELVSAIYNSLFGTGFGIVFLLCSFQCSLLL